MSQDAINGALHDAKQTTSNLRQELQNGASSLLSNLEDLTKPIAERTEATVDDIVPLKQRAALWEQIKAFLVLHPALSAFLAINIVFTGIPLSLFVGFSLGTFIFALVTCVSIALFCAVLFALSCAGLALIIVVPTIFFTTIAACSVFWIGFVGFHLLKWIDNRSKPRATPQKGEIDDETNMSEFQKKWESLSGERVVS